MIWIILAILVVLIVLIVILERLHHIGRSYQGLLYPYPVVNVERARGTGMCGGDGDGHFGGGCRRGYVTGAVIVVFSTCKLEPDETPPSYYREHVVCEACVYAYWPELYHQVYGRFVRGAEVRFAKGGGEDVA